MSPRAIALVELLQHELSRVGRPNMAVMLESDERTVTLEDSGGRWHGPLPVAYGALAVYGDGEAGSDQFWKRIETLPS